MRDPGPLPLIELWRRTVGEDVGPWRASLGEADVAWAIQTGMAALLFDTVEPGQLEESLAARLLAAERWARLRHADSLAAALEILDACAERVPPLTLLKGLSIGPERYPAPHYRFLGDLDLLVEVDALKATLQVLEELGYASSPLPQGEDPATHHHLPPLKHPRTGVWVELHTELFPASAGLGRAGPFSPAGILTERRPSKLEGRPVFRLSPELQVVYTASHWALDFVPAAGARAFLDQLLLLRGAGDHLNWDRIVGWLEHPRIAAHLQLMLSCLEAWDLLPVPARLREHWQRAPALSPAALEVLIGMAERYQVCGSMAGVPELAATRRPGGAAATGTFGSRLDTLRTAVATRNLRGVLPILDTIPWSVLRHPRPALVRYLVVLWCRLFPPGDPDRFMPRWMSRVRSGPVG